MSEQILWKGSPSQILNLGKHALGVLLVALVITGGCYYAPVFFALPLPLLWMGWNFLTVRCRVYELTEERLRLYEGVLNQKIDEVELYRVKDTTMSRPLWLRLFGLCSLHLDTSDRTCPEIEIKAIKDATQLRETLRKQVEYWRDRKRVREVDFEDGDLDGDDMLS